MIAWIGLSRKQHVTKLRIPQLSIDISVQCLRTVTCCVTYCYVADSPYVTVMKENYVLSTGTDRCEIYRDACRSVYFKRESISVILK